jgi:hypothetical protein
MCGMDAALWQLIAVITGGVLATAGSIVTTAFVERRRERRESERLAMAFRGEIAALVHHIEERGYLANVAEIVAAMEETGERFILPTRVQMAYDRVYESNAERIGALKRPVAGRIPLFYTRLYAILDDLMNLAEGTYSDLDTALLSQVYRDLQVTLEATITLGHELLRDIDACYPDGRNRAGRARR